MENLDRKKLTIITVMVLFGLCVLFYFAAHKDEAKGEETITEREKIEMEEADTKSDFDFSNIEVSYHALEAEINMVSIFEKNEQVNYFKYRLYEFLYEKGYKELQKFDVSGGCRDENGKIYFLIDVTKSDDEEFSVGCWYDDTFLNFYFALEDDWEGNVITFMDMDTDLLKLLGDNLESIEEDFGSYLFKEKIEATKAKVTYWEVKDDTVEIQTELNDEYLTYCKIYYHITDHTYEFKKWG